MRKLFLILLTTIVCGCGGSVAEQPAVPHFFSVHGFLTREIKGDVHKVSDRIRPVSYTEDGRWEALPDSTERRGTVVFDREGYLLNQRHNYVSDDFMIMYYRHEGDRSWEQLSLMDEPVEYVFEYGPDMLTVAIDYHYFKSLEKHYYTDGELARSVSQSGMNTLERLYEYDEQGRVSRVTNLQHNQGITRFEYLGTDSVGNWTSRLAFDYSYPIPEDGKPWRIRLTERDIEYY